MDDDPPNDIERPNQEQEFVSKLQNPQYRIIGVTAGSKMGKSTFMQQVITKVQRTCPDVPFVTIDVSCVTSHKEFATGVLKGVCSKLHVDFQKFEPLSSNIVLEEQVENVLSIANCKNIWVFFDNIPRPADKNSDEYSPKNDAQTFMLKALKKKMLRPVIRFLYTSALQLRFAGLPRTSAFEQTLRPLDVEESRQVFDRSGPEGVEVDDAVVQCITEEVGGNPLVIQVLASDLGTDDGLISSADMKLLVLDDHTRLDFVSRENYTDDENIGKQLDQYVKSLTKDLQEHGLSIVKYGGEVNVDMMARAENKPVAIIKFYVSKMIRANLVQKKPENKYVMSPLLMDVFKANFKVAERPVARRNEENLSNDEHSYGTTPGSDNKITKQAEENQDISINDLANSTQVHHHPSQKLLPPADRKDMSGKEHLESTTKHEENNKSETSLLLNPDTTFGVEVVKGDTNDLSMNATKISTVNDACFSTTTQMNIENNKSNDLSKKELSTKHVDDNLRYTGTSETKIVTDIGKLSESDTSASTVDTVCLSTTPQTDDSVGVSEIDKQISIDDNCYYPVTEPCGSDPQNNTNTKLPYQKKKTNIRKSYSDTNLSSVAKSVGPEIEKSHEVTVRNDKHMTSEQMTCVWPPNAMFDDFTVPCVSNVTSDSNNNLYTVTSAMSAIAPGSVGTPELRNLKQADMQLPSTFVNDNSDSFSETCRKQMY